MTRYLVLSWNKDGSIKEKRQITDFNAEALKKAKMGHMIMSDNTIIAAEKEEIERTKEEEELFSW